MAKIRSLNQQIQFAISKNTRFGKSKHAESRNKNFDNSPSVYSINRAEDLRETVKSFAKYMKEYHPEIRMAYAITTEHVQAFISYKSPVWSEATAKEIVSRFSKIDTIVSHTYKDTMNFSKGIEAQYGKAYKIRDKAMRQGDFERLRESFSNSRSVGKDAIEITHRTGVRVLGVSCLRARDIDIENKTIFVCKEGAKNGRERYVPIRDKDLDYFRDLKDRARENIGGLVCKGSPPGTINKAIRREMRKITLDDGRSMATYYPNTTEHSIRKLYAHERMEELRGSEPLEDRSKEMKCFDIVSCELGHGENRGDLYDRYCG